MPDTALAAAADYADALLTARRAKNWLFLLLLLVIVGQIALFVVAHTTELIVPPPAVDGVATTQPEDAVAFLPMHYVVAMTQFLGITLGIVLALVLLLIVLIMLVGRLVGVSRTTSAFIWCLLLVVLLFPWQAFLNNADFTAVDFKIPGALYTWEELQAKGRFHDLKWEMSILRWARFVGFPVVAFILLLMVQVKSNRALRQAMGEAPAESESIAAGA